MKVSNLKAYLANIGMTIKDFCVIIDCDHKYLSKIMTGKAKASHRLAKDIKEATDGLIVLEAAPKKRHKDKEKASEEPKIGKT